MEYYTVVYGLIGINEKKIHFEKNKKKRIFLLFVQRIKSIPLIDGKLVNK